MKKMSRRAKRLLRFLLSPTALMVLLLFLQFCAAAALLVVFGLEFTLFFPVLVAASLLLSLILFDKDPAPPSYKLMWLWIFVLLPLAGELLYFLWGRTGLFPKKEAVFRAGEVKADGARRYDRLVLRQLDALDSGLACQAKYLAHEHNPLYGGTQATYFGRGEQLFASMLAELEQAQHSIWMEYFIFDEDSGCWPVLAELLKRKAAAGVDVRILYDAVGCLFTFSGRSRRTLCSCGIRCHTFNPLRFSAHISDYSFLNHRDHRKLCIIDGCIGFTGGVNIADEYFGRAQPFGRWKDASLLLRGPAVHSLACTFLKNWDIASGEAADPNSIAAPSPLPTPDDALVQPFDDSPLGAEAVSQNAYSNLLRHAHRYVWITTPYLIPDHRMIGSLCLTAKSGVEVRIITPGIPDKKSVFLVTRSYYRSLMANGIRVFEYTPGFLHSKTALCDDKVAIIGTANMDYRSLHLQFENSCAFYGGKILCEIRRDFEEMFAESREIIPQDLQFPLHIRLAQIVLRFFAPLL